MHAFTRSVLKMGEMRQFVHFLTIWALPYIGFSTLVFWESVTKLVLSYALCGSILVIEAGAYLWYCRLSQKEVVRYFPHIKVSDESGVITTMTPKAYIGQINATGLDYPLTILPLVVNITGHRHAFSVERFTTALDSALKAREERSKKA